MGMRHALFAAGVGTGAMDEAVGDGAYSGDRDVVALHLV